MKAPERMCIACRAHKAKGELLRVVKNKSGGLYFDYSGKAAGRGAYICAEADCMKLAIKKRLFNRAFKCEIPEAVLCELAETISKGEANKA